jgi:hypothetical protein
MHSITMTNKIQYHLEKTPNKIRVSKLVLLHRMATYSSLLMMLVFMNKKDHPLHILVAKIQDLIVVKRVKHKIEIFTSQEIGILRIECKIYHKKTLLIKKIVRI